ncbi:MAG: hypothetical protein RR138_06400 [Akkermansia sp.]
MSIANYDDNELIIMTGQFEDCSHQNGVCYWLDTDLMRLLGYTDFVAFRKIIMKAIASCASLEIDPLTDFQSYHHTTENGAEGHYKFTRLACFLITQHANQNIPNVGILQYCLARMADAMMQTEDFERLETRGRLTSEEKSLSSIAKRSGVTNFGLFKDAGYRGMYNMSLTRLKKHKGIGNSPNPLYDRMSNTELAANLFRITQTEERIKSKNVRGQTNLENAAHNVGMEVRRIMIKNTGKAPESIPLAPTEIKQIKQEGKKAIKNIRNVDKQPPSRKKGDK